tara:strand:- start:2026 stop:2277 length:252 start_codon:yes stop_codon:yes gene_type:complete
MFNPLAKDPTNLSDDQIQEKITELQKKYLTASRFPNQDLIRQLQNTLTMYVEEQSKRNRNKLLQQQNKDKESNKDLGDLINVQ